MADDNFNDDKQCDKTPKGSKNHFSVIDEEDSKNRYSGKKVPLAHVKFLNEDCYEMIFDEKKMFPFESPERDQFINAGWSLKDEELHSCFQTALGKVDGFDASTVTVTKPTEHESSVTRSGGDTEQKVKPKRKSTATPTDSKKSAKRKIESGDNFPAHLFSCDLCDFGCRRINVLIEHQRGHIKSPKHKNWKESKAGPVDIGRRIEKGQAVKRKLSRKIKAPNTESKAPNTESKAPNTERKTPNTESKLTKKLKLDKKYTKPSKKDKSPKHVPDGVSDAGSKQPCRLPDFFDLSDAPIQTNSHEILKALDKKSEAGSENDHLLPLDDTSNKDAVVRNYIEKHFQSHSAQTLVTNVPLSSTPSDREGVLNHADIFKQTDSAPPVNLVDASTSSLSHDGASTDHGFNNLSHDSRSSHGGFVDGDVEEFDPAVYYINKVVNQASTSSGTKEIAESGVTYHKTTSLNESGSRTSCDRNLDADACDSDPDLPIGLSPMKLDWPKIKDIMWVKIGKYPHWPAIVVKVYTKKKIISKLSVKFIGDIPTSKDSMHGFGVNYRRRESVVPFHNSRRQEFLDAGMESEFCECFLQAVESVDDYFTKKGLGLVANDVEFFSLNGDVVPPQFYQTPNAVSISGLSTTSSLSSVSHSDSPAISSSGSPSECGCEELWSEKQKIRLEKRKEKNQKLVDYIVSDDVRAYLQDIFTGKRNSDRHHQYYNIVSERNRLRNPGFGPITDEGQQDSIVDTMAEWFRTFCNRFPDVDYILDVWVPEALVHALITLKKYSRKRAWKQFHKGVKITQEECKTIHNSMIEGAQNISPADRLRYKEKFDERLKFSGVDLMQFPMGDSRVKEQN